MSEDTKSAGRVLYGGVVTSVAFFGVADALLDASVLVLLAAWLPAAVAAGVVAYRRGVRVSLDVDDTTDTASGARAGEAAD
ncbi:hypothetical protein [Halocalculus aciditolerans]|uniref:Uncharacterized protein n=1 Tax=Halocalculus aciditolerans TaxID=1383812 RepID=A0A830FH10_9EURY|nr:hypothetical protein [Halocalculus aciditolerans]GGL73738.1 hypothetical protein GCM10009039_34810 [Halocalculus aciditolerans]